MLPISLRITTSADAMNIIKVASFNKYFVCSYVLDRMNLMHSAWFVMSVTSHACHEFKCTYNPTVYSIAYNKATIKCLHYWPFNRTVNKIASSDSFPDRKVHGANMGPIWGRQDPGGPHVGPMNLTIWVVALYKIVTNVQYI